MKRLGFRLREVSILWQSLLRDPRFLRSKRRARRAFRENRNELLRFWRIIPPQGRWAVLGAFVLGMAGEPALLGMARLPGIIQAWWKAKTDSHLAPVRVAEAEMGEIAEDFSVFTTLLPQREAVLRPPSQVVVSEVMAKIGDPVRRGQALVRFRSDSQKLRSELEQIDLARKEMDIELTLALSKKNFVSGRELKQSELDQKATQIRRRLNDAESTTVLRSPIDGVVSELNLFAGDFVDQVKSYSVRIIQPVGFRAQVYVPQSIASRLKNGGAAQIALTDGETTARQWTDGEVDAIGATIDTKTGSVFVDVLVSEAPSTWRAGSLIELRLILASQEAATLIPAVALLEQKEGFAVYRIKEEKTSEPKEATRALSSILTSQESLQVEFVPVKLGIRSGESVEIVEGLSPGDRVVVRGQTLLEDGRAVEIVDGAAP